MHTDTNSTGAKIITVFGGSGFLGRHVVRELARRGFQVRVAVRRPDLAFHLQPLGDVGQITCFQANLRFPKSITKAINGAHGVINLAGILQEGGRQKFQSVHVGGAARIAQATKAMKIPLVHVSAIGADENSDCDYFRTKAEGEAQVLKIDKSAIIIRPSILFGSGDNFFMRFAQIAAISPFLPLIGGGKTRFQPVYVGDVARAIALGIEGKLDRGKAYELGGSEILSFRQCMELMLKEIGRKKTLLSIPWFAARIMAWLTGWVPGAPITSDQVRMLAYDNVVSERAKKQKRTLAGIGITPKTLGSVLPDYLVQFRPHGQFSKLDENQTV